MSTNDGDLPAFPFASDICGHHGGMTLRDYFAAQALNGFMSIPGGGDPKTDAAYAYRIADAMLAARAAPTGDTHG